jgi:hypothetical protein
MPDDVKSKRKSEERRWLGEMERLGYPIVAARFANRMAVIDMMLTPKRILFKRGSVRKSAPQTAA